MPRTARKQSSTGIYHIILRGINKMNIFLDNYDKHNFLKRLSEVSTNANYKIYAYCLMNNHIHLLLKESNETIGTFVKRIATGYAGYFNTKYERVGHFFQDRFKSEPVETDQYLMNLVKYIHNNPVKAGLSTNPEDYKWSSAFEYIYPEKVKIKIIFDNTLINLYGISKEQYIEFSKIEDNNKYMDIQLKLSEKELFQIYQDFLKRYGLQNIKEADKSIQNEIINQLNIISGFSVRKISKLTEMNSTAIWKMIKMKQKNRPLVSFSSLVI